MRTPTPPVDLRARLLAVARGTGGRWVSTPQAAEARRLLTRGDPLLFTTMYLPAALRSPETGGAVSFCQFHLDIAAAAVQWMRTDLGPAECRDAWVAPRGSGKSTWGFKALPMWSLAHGHRKYVAAFADSGPQSQQHLTSFKRELDTNELLRYDYPKLCAPARRPSGVTVTDSQALMIAESGAVFQARGIDSSTLGAKVGDQRPDLILFDDVEPPGALYSQYQKEKRLQTILEAVNPMSLNAAQAWLGTTTMHGSVIHDLVRQVVEPATAPEWPRDERVRVHYYPAIVTDDDGAEASLWPERWTLEYLQGIRHTRSFKANYLNLPASEDSDYWTADDFRYGTPPAVTRVVLSIDPAVTSKKGADPTGLAVVGYDPTAQECVVLHASSVRLTPAGLRARVLQLIERHPSVKAVLLETNQGGDYLAEVLSPLPAKVITIHQSEPKTVRAAKALDHYQSHRVWHEDRVCAAVFEQEAQVFPRAAHDDTVDAVSSAVNWFLADFKKPPAAARRTSTYA